MHACTYHGIGAKVVLERIDRGTLLVACRHIVFVLVLVRLITKRIWQLSHPTHAPFNRRWPGWGT